LFDEVFAVFALIFGLISVSFNAWYFSCWKDGASVSFDVSRAVEIAALVIWVEPFVCFSDWSCD